VVEAKEAAEIIQEAASERENTSGRFPLNKIVALLVAILAASLAVATISTGAATRRLLNDNIHLNDLHAMEDVGDVRQSNASVTADLIESILTTTNPSDTARTALQQKANDYRASANEIQGANKGLKAIQEEIAQYDGLEETTESQILSFEYSEVALQIAIVLSSLAILTVSWGIFYVSAGLGVLGLILTINGFVLMVGLPSLH
jgi:hypothetical protein